MTDLWKPWYSRIGKLKGIAVVHQASDCGLELHTDLMPEHRLEYCERLCEKLNRPADDFRKIVEERAIRYIRSPLSLTALCNLCGETTQSMSIHRMDPPTRHVKDCPLAAADGGGEHG